MWVLLVKMYVLEIKKKNLDKIAAKYLAILSQVITKNTYIFKYQYFTVTTGGHLQDFENQMQKVSHK